MQVQIDFSLLSSLFADFLLIRTELMLVLVSGLLHE
jgi:hypothetical protein